MQANTQNEVNNCSGVATASKLQSGPLTALIGCLNVILFTVFQF